MRLYVLLILAYSLLIRPAICAQNDANLSQKDSSIEISLLYTGRSLGALGVFRSQREHELVTEQANAENLPFKLVSHACWRAPGLVVFLPSDEPKGNELELILSLKEGAVKYANQRAFITQNVVLVQDPYRNTPDMLDLLKRNQRQPLEFPDLVQTMVTIYSLTVKGDHQAYILEMPEAEWPSDPLLWTKGEVNRVDIGDGGRLFELPFNLGEIVVRSEVLKKTTRDLPLKTLIDLGHIAGQFGMGAKDLARLNYTLLDQMGYTISVPYHFELFLGADTLISLKKEFPHLRFLATNVKSKDSTLFDRHLIETYGPVKIGFIGLVDPTLQGDLSKKSLEDFRFVSAIESARSEIRVLRQEKVQAIIVLSNMDPMDHALLAQEVDGIDVIIADLQKNWSLNPIQQSITLAQAHRQSTGAPSLITRSFANGVGVGHLRLKFTPGMLLSKIDHSVLPVTDRTPIDTVMHRDILAQGDRKTKPKGELLFPAFIDILGRNPDLKNFDAITQQGRVSQKLWEEFIARLLRKAGPTELTILRRFPLFPPLIGKLHEDEVQSWLGVEEDIILCDVKGSSLLKLLADDVHGDLIMSGLSRPSASTLASSGVGLPSLSTDWYQAHCRVMGRPIDPAAYYRVATTDVIFEGIRASDFTDSRRVRKYFMVDQDGLLLPDPDKNTLSLRTYVLNELLRLRRTYKGEKKYLDAIADRLMPDPIYERLLIFNFDRPTLWTSYNRKYNSDGYGAVPESRITATNSWVIGASGQFRATIDGQHSSLNLGLTLAYAKQNAEISKTVQQITESDDDIKLDLTYKYKTKGVLKPFIRGQYDTEFTPTINPVSFESNYKQQALRGVFGFTRNPWRHWKNIELASILEQDFAQDKAQFGFTGRAQGSYPIGHGGVVYSLRNEATYFFNSSQDTNRDLALKYNMIHEILVPLVDELSLSVGADFYFFKGKVSETKEPGMSMLLRVGITYDRLWKPRYQPLF